MSNRNVKNKLLRIYARALSQHGARPEGVLWPNGEDLLRRFGVFLEFLELEKHSPENRLRLLDLGCGPGLLADVLQMTGLKNRINYCGVDTLEDTIRLAQGRHPDLRFECREIRDVPFDAGEFDYCIICGVFTGKFDISHQEMEEEARSLLISAWNSAKMGVVFNAMSSHVDWEREDLFHWPLDRIMAFSRNHLSRHVAMRMDYGLWETTVCVRRKPSAFPTELPDCWNARWRDT